MRLSQYKQLVGRCSVKYYIIDGVTETLVISSFGVCVHLFLKYVFHIQLRCKDK